MFVIFAIKQYCFFGENYKIPKLRCFCIDKHLDLGYTILANKIYEKDKAKLTVLHDLFKAKQLVEY